MQTRASRPPGQDQFFAEIAASAAALAEIAASHDNEIPVPSCPDWSLRQLATHVGRVHRWAAEIVSTRSQEFIPFSAVPDGRYPAAPDERAAWLTAGAGRVIDAIAAAGEAPVWAFGASVPAGFWARRQAHETMVHRADAQLTAGLAISLDPDLAADGLDEWLSMVARGRGDNPPLPADAALELVATRPGSDDVIASWLLRGTGDGVVVTRRGGSGTAAGTVAGAAAARVAGPADRLLLVMVRRAPATDPAVTVIGDAGLLAGWLADTPF